MEKKASESLTEQVHLVMNQDINGNNRLFGGRLMEWIDEVGAITAMRHSGHNVTTAAIKNLQFKSGAYLGEMIVMTGRVIYVGRSSMQVRVDVYKENSEGMRQSINRAFLTEVALDEEEQPIVVPRLIIENEFQQEEWNIAKQWGKFTD